MGKLNCWNFKNCGRYPGGPKEHELGTCPVPIMDEADGFLGGRGAGRGCAYVAGSYCGGEVQGSYEFKKKHCEDCEYYKALQAEFGATASVMAFRNFTKHKNQAILSTPQDQPWVSPYKSPERSSQEAQARYRFRRKGKGTGTG